MMEPLFDYLRLSAYNTLKPIEPAGYFAVGRRYVHPPRVEWQPVAGAVRYRLILLQDGVVLGVTPADASPHSIQSGWGKARPGKAAIVIEGFDQNGARLALSRLFPFYVVPSYDRQACTPRKRPYLEAALAAFDALDRFILPAASSVARIGQHAIKPVLLGTSCTPNWLSPHSFPNLHDWMHIDMCRAMVHDADDALRERLLSYAHSAGEHLLLCRLPQTENAYGGFIRSAADASGGAAYGIWEGYAVDPAERVHYERLIEPHKNGYSGEALVKLYEMLGETRYLVAALELAEALARTLPADGLWPARVDGKTGEVVSTYSTALISVAAFLNRLHVHRPDPRWIAMRDRSLEWIRRNPLRSFAWVANFDDCLAGAAPDNPYQSLSNWDLFHFIQYACDHPEQWEGLADLLREHLDWNDNHFVFYGPDPLLPIEPHYPTCAEQGNPGSFTSGSSCWVPMDFHTANWGLALLRVYRLTGEAIWLEKARAAGNALTHYQLEDGRTITWMPDRHFGLSAQINGTATQDFWPAAWARSATLWTELARFED